MVKNTTCCVFDYPPTYLVCLQWGWRSLKLHWKLLTDIVFNGSRTTMCQILRKLWFLCKKNRDNRIILIERQYVRYQTLCLISYLCLWTYIYSNTHKTPFSYKSTGTGAHAAVSKGNTLIILIACSEAGFFFQMLCWQCKFSGQMGDYHGDMNSNFIKWLHEKL